MEILDVKGLRKDFGKNQVLKGIDFSVHEKEIVGFFRTEWFRKVYYDQVYLWFIPYDRRRDRAFAVTILTGNGQKP